MLGPILDRILNFNLGLIGQSIVAFVELNMTFFLIAFAIYGVLILYAKVIWVKYLPAKMRLFLDDNYSTSESPEKLFTRWLIERRGLPLYLLVPTKNEWWVKPLAKMRGDEKMLLYNSKSKKMTEKQRFCLLFTQKFDGSQILNIH